ncbi:MAG: hypothetical protein UT29_C0001G0152 [Candidatus Yanofskybacteria bacterium GW2011_GWA1_39_13]|uniref:Uncharacterized protein n=1 Tax=Yanofskybacteria sp. (strain GW2011_GWA1_39_13) TaxID=1619019 RepID=A0A0G0QLX6_YANXG|nr:MAG: hypothetical protein UT29_C0001G0152 [Candidatus Yanofskybacteria bacterium GW2011_GWA1_39_13]
MGKYSWIVVGVVVLVAIYFMGGDWMGKKTGDEVVSLSPSPSSKVVAKTVTKTSPTPTSTKSYTELVKEYEGRRIQFDQYCQATPKDITYKNGTSIMLDNRSGDARTITLADAKYQLSGYGYAVVTLSSQSLPKEMLLSCGAGINVGRILLQAQILQ